MPALMNQKWETFAHLVAQDVNVANAYTSVGYSAKGAHKSSSRLLRIPEIRERILEIKGNIARLAQEKAAKKYLTDNEKRLECATLRHRLIHEVLEDRAKDPTMQDVPGGKTGILVRKLKQIGSGDNAQVVEEFEVDTATLAEARKLEEHAAQLTGEWQPDGGRSGDGAVLVVIPASLAPAAEQPRQIDDSMVIDLVPE